MKHLANKSSPKSNEIREHYWEMLQNPILFSPVYGRAEIYQGLPYYCDGENLFVVGYSIDDSEIEIDKRISGVVSLARDRWRDRLQSIQFWGPVRPNDFIVPNDFIRTLELKPNHSNRDVILFLDDASLKRVRSGRDIRRAFRNGLSVEINYSKATTAEHSKIFEKFFQTHTDIERDDLSYFTHWTDVLKDKDSLLFEVKQSGRLTGFAILNCFARHTATYAYGFFDNSVAGTSDLAHAAMIEYCHKSQFDMLDLGYSIHSKLLRYKRKWGRTRLVDPPWSVHWEWRDTLVQKQIKN